MIAVLRLEQVELVAEVEQRRPVGVGDFVGRLDAVAQRLDLSAGIAGDTLEGIDSTEESALRELAIKTVSRREVTVGRNLVDDPPHEEWGEHAQNHGYRTCAFIPLVYDDTLYGVLHLATDRPEGFGTAERESLGELGRTIAYALETAASSTAAHGTVREEVETDLTRWTAEPEQERRLYETIISSTPDLVYAFDLDYRFIFANDALQTKEPVRGEGGSSTPNSATESTTTSLRRCSTTRGEVEAIAGATRDITERKEAEEALQKSEEPGGKYPRSRSHNYPEYLVFWSKLLPSQHEKERPYEEGRGVGDNDHGFRSSDGSRGTEGSCPGGRRGSLPRTGSSS